jgi:hypothetical protein
MLIINLLEGFRVIVSLSTAFDQYRGMFAKVSHLSSFIDDFLRIYLLYSILQNVLAQVYMAGTVKNCRIYSKKVLRSVDLCFE